MAFANPSISDIAATTIQNRSRDLADNVTKNNALFAYLKKGGNVRPISGGDVILEELAFAENGNAMFYSGADHLSIMAQEVLSAAQFPWAQAAVAVSLTGLEKLQNAGRERMIDLLDGRLGVAESSIVNLLSESAYSDGSAFGGKQVTGLAAAVPTAPTTGTYGGIDRANFTFWRPKLVAPGAGVITAANINTYFNDLWSQLVRGKDHPNLIVLDNNLWKLYVAYLQGMQLITKADVGELGFPTLRFMGADVILDGGVGGFCPANTGFFLNTKYLFWRPSKSRNMSPLNPGTRVAVDQDVEVQLIGWAGQMTTNGAQYQGRIHNN